MARPDRLTDRQTDRQTGRQTDKQTDRQTFRQTNRQTENETERQRQKENACFSTFDLITMDRLMDQYTKGWTDKQMDKASYRFYD